MHCRSLGWHDIWRDIWRDNWFVAERRQLLTMLRPALRRANGISFINYKIGDRVKGTSRVSFMDQVDSEIRTFTRRETITVAR